MNKDIISRKRIKYEMCESNMPKRYREFCERVIEDENLTPSVELVTCQQDLSDYIVDNKNMIEEDVRTSINNILTDINVAEGGQEFDIFDEVNLDILVDEVTDNLITGLINVIRTYEPIII